MFWLTRRPKPTPPRRPARIGRTAVAVRPPVDPSRRPTAIPAPGAPSVVVYDAGTAFDPELAEGDTAFCSVGFRMFLTSALREMDGAFRQGVHYRAGLRQVENARRAEQWARRTARNQDAAAHAAGGLTLSTSPRIAQTIVARALHASDATADTGLLPAVAP